MAPIIPAAVGVDIGCGMIAVRTPLDAQRHRRPAADPRRHRTADSDERRQEQREAHRDSRRRGSQPRALAKDDARDADQYDKNWQLALGTLGGGNHFIELAEDGTAPSG